MEFLTENAPFLGSVMQYFEVFKVVLSDVRLIWFAGFFAFFYIKSAMKNERAIQKVHDTEKQIEKDQITKRIKCLLAQAETAMYEAMERFVYNDPTGHNRRLKIVRSSSKVNIPAQSYLRDVHGGTKSVLFKVVLPYIIEQIDVYSVATKEQYDDDKGAVAGEIRQLYLSELHKKVGANDDVRKIEDDSLPYEYFLDMYESIIKSAQHIRFKRDLAIEKGIKEHRMPLVPRLRRKK